MECFVYSLLHMARGGAASVNTIPGPFYRSKQIMLFFSYPVFTKLGVLRTERSERTEALSVTDIRRE